MVALQLFFRDSVKSRLRCAYVTVICDDYVRRGHLCHGTVTVPLRSYDVYVTVSWLRSYFVTGALLFCNVTGTYVTVT